MTMKTHKLVFAPSPGVVFIAKHPFVKLCFCQDTHRWAFAHYFYRLQMKQFLAEVQHRELLSLREAIERYITSSDREIAEEMEEVQ